MTNDEPENFMKQIKLKTRFGNAAEAFFTGEFSAHGGSMIYREKTAPSPNTKIAEIRENYGWLIEILKRSCLFFPGAFMLYFLSFGLSFRFVGKPFQPIFDPFFYLFFCIALFFFSLMTWFGIGSLRNSRHCVIPLSIISVGVVVGVVSGLFPHEFVQTISRNLSYQLYFLPLALIAPFLAKGWVDLKSYE